MDKIEKLLNKYHVKSDKKRKLIKALLNGPTLSEEKIKKWQSDLEKMRGRCE